jgi:hypothetical protein
LFLPPIYCFGLGAVLLMVVGLTLLRMLDYRLMIIDPAGKLSVETDDLRAAAPSASVSVAPPSNEAPPPPASS